MAPVLLIDELDRTDEPFEAYLLEVLVRLPGDDSRARRDQRAAQPPIVVITSNRTREIHDAIKRRCLYHWVDYPERRSASSRSCRRKVPGADARLSREVVAFTQRLRAMDLFKAPGIAETLDWAEALVALDQRRARSGDGRQHARCAAQVSGRHRRHLARRWRRTSSPRRVPRPQHRA